MHTIASTALHVIVTLSPYAGNPSAGPRFATFVGPEIDSQRARSLGGPSWPLIIRFHRRTRSLFLAASPRFLPRRSGGGIVLGRAHNEGKSASLSPRSMKSRGMRETGIRISILKNDTILVRAILRSDEAILTLEFTNVKIVTLTVRFPYIDKRKTVKATHTDG